MKTAIYSALLASTLICTPSWADEKTQIQLIIDASGVMHDEQDNEGRSSFKAHVRQFLGALARKHRRDREDTQIRIISASEYPHIIWSGSAADLYREGLESDALQALSNENPGGCNNLIEALQEAAVGVEIHGADSKDVLFVITSGVHTGPGCDEITQEDYNRAVANADPDVIAKIAETSAQFDAVTIQFLTAPQRRAFLAGLRASKNVRLFAQGEEARF